MERAMVIEPKPGGSPLSDPSGIRGAINALRAIGV